MTPKPLLGLALATSLLACDQQPTDNLSAPAGAVNKAAPTPKVEPPTQEIVAPDMVQGKKIVAPDMVQKPEMVVAPMFHK